jgi:hypothetical protein
MPIPAVPVPASSGALVFVSDVVGARFGWFHGKRVPIDDGDDRGVASIGVNGGGDVWFYARVSWPKRFLLKATDSKGSALGCKSATLEAVGLILPFLTAPEKLRGREVKLLVDNISLEYGWEKKHIKFDRAASVLLRALHLIAVWLQCKVYVEHLPRMSSPAAVLADHLSRRSTTTRADRRAVYGAAARPAPRILMSWLRHPSDDWLWAYRFLESVQASARPA